MSFRMALSASRCEGTVPSVAAASNEVGAYETAGDAFASAPLREA